MRHSGAEPTGPAFGRPDDRLSEKPGIHSPSVGGLDMDCGLAASKSAVADLDIQVPISQVPISQVPISGKPEIGGAPE